MIHNTNVENEIKFSKATTDAKNLMLNVWSSVLAGQAVLASYGNAKKESSEDGVEISEHEGRILLQQKAVFFSSLGILIRDTVQFLDKVGLGKVSMASARIIGNALQFIDKLDGTPLTPRPQIDVVQGSYNKPLHKINSLL